MRTAPAPPLTVPIQQEPEYPCSDGEPIADSTLQFDVIGNLAAEFKYLFRDDPNVAVHFDLFWYPVRGRAQVVRAPDVMVIFGCPKSQRESYKQWEEDDVAPQVTIEVRSHSNTPANLAATFAFYEEYGVEEYYLYDPRVETIEGWRRVGRRLQPIESLDGWESPRLRIRIERKDGKVRFLHPSGEPFGDVVETKAAGREAQARADREERRAIREQIRAEQAEAAASEERMHAAEERERSTRAEAVATEERRRAEEEGRARAAAETEVARMQAELERALGRLRLAGLSNNE